MVMPDLQVTHSKYGFPGFGIKFRNILINNKNQRKLFQIPYFLVIKKAMNLLSITVR